MNTWQQHLLRSGTVGEVLSISREYLASWSPVTLASVPEDCRPGRIKGVDDVYFWRDQLLGKYCEGAARGHAESLIRDLLAYFSAAAERAEALHVEFDPLKTIPALFSDKSIPRLLQPAPARVR